MQGRPLTRNKGSSDIGQIITKNFCIPRCAPVNVLYFYYKDGQWGMSVSLPVEVRIDINDFVTLEMNTERPYEYDYEVVKRYPPGQLKKRNKIKRKAK